MSKGVHLPDERLLVLFSVARSGLADALEGVRRVQPNARPTEHAVVVNLVVYSQASLHASKLGGGPDLESAVLDAAGRAAEDRRFGDPPSLESVPGLRLDLWVRICAGHLTAAHELADIDLGLHGIELRFDRRRAYYVPSVALTSEVGSVELLLDRLARKAGLPAGIWRIPPALIRRTTWAHFVQLPGAERPLLRLHRLRPLPAPEVSRATVLAALRRGQDRLVGVQEESGLYLYRYRPFADEIEPGPPNFVRQAGCAYALAATAAGESDPTRRAILAGSAAAAIKALPQRTVAKPSGELSFDDAHVSPGARAGPLGTLALAHLALTHLAGVDGPFTFNPARGALRETMLARQREDGSFRCFADDRSPLDDGRSQSFYPGETLLALAQEPEDDEILVACRRAFPWYRDYFRRTHDLHFIVWQAAAWRRLAECDVASANQGFGNETAQFVLEMVDLLVGRQLCGRDARHPDFVGGFVTGPSRLPDFSTAMYTEAAAHGTAVARRVGDAARVARYELAVRRGLGFLLRLQISPELAPLFPDARRVVGASTQSLASFRLRCDFDQHTITAASAALDLPGLLP